MRLDKDQQPIVESESNKIMVLAPSGSGKTAVLIERVRHLIVEKKVEPSSIVCITFTNTAAQEMRSRLKDVEGVGDAFIGTIHSFANGIYRQSGLTYSLLTLDAEIDLMKEILVDAGSYPNLTLQIYTQYLDVRRKVEIGELDAEDVSPGTYFTPSQYKDYKNAMNVFETMCKVRNIISFSELLDKTRKYYATLGASLDYVLVDEFQDVGMGEAQFIMGLNSDNLFFIGDDYQNIFSFKGANVNIFKNVVKDKTFSVYRLKNNYRSSQEIIDFATKIIEQVPDRIDKEVVVMSKAKGSVKVDTKGNIDKYIEQISNSKDYKDWFILCRANKEVYEVVGKLKSLGIPSSTFKRSGMTASELENLLEENKVKVLTVHVSKGLESKNVMLYGNFPVKLPSWMQKTRNKKQLEEERRVMYVGATRSRENLIVLN